MSSGLRTFGLSKTTELLAASATLQAVFAAAYSIPATPAAALAHIHELEAIDKESEHPLPRVMVRLGSEFESTKIGTATWNAQGTVEVCFQFPIPDTTASPAANMRAFVDRIGAILDEVMALAGGGNAPDGLSYLNIEGISSPNGAPGFAQLQHENGDECLIDDYTFRWKG